MARPVRWTEEEKRQMVTMRSQNQHMSWEDFQKVSTLMNSQRPMCCSMVANLMENLWPTRTVGALAFMYSEVNRMDRLNASAQDQNIPEQSPPNHPLPDNSPPDQFLSSTAKRPPETLREGEAACDIAGSPAQSSHTVKHPRMEHSNVMKEQQIAGSADRGHSKSTDPKSPEASIARQNGVNTSSPNLTIANAIHSHPCKTGTQSELTEAAQVEEEAANGLPLPCSITDAVPNETTPSGPTPVQQLEKPMCDFQGVDPLGVNRIENEIADLAQRFCDDISVVRKRRKMIHVQQSELTEAFSSLQSNLLDLKHKVEQKEEEGNQVQAALKQLQQQMENQIKEAVKKAVSEANEENDRLRSEIRVRSRNTIELKRRHDKLEKENTTLRETLKGIFAAAKPYNST
ncbi:hypothetical protein PISL3812_05494 [Talaromyces islandicus]|uniref:Uncharacterized protein n=1 Tax=Talaromyces islandicus TaxID=28573 RepID=A0A0U1LYP7_TALIS|nr:hypothetical protein PISL3812_05494 [Talaromyces islandicus]